MTGWRSTFAGLAAAWRRAVEQRGMVAAYAALSALLLTAAAVAPLLVDRAADAGLRHEVASAGTGAQLGFDVRATLGTLGPALDAIAGAPVPLPPHLASVTGLPAVAATTRTGVARSGAGTFEVARVTTVHPPVRWLAGGAPGPSDPTLVGGVVPVALSADNARLLGVTAGDDLTGTDDGATLHVTGVFAPLDAHDPLWSAAPELLRSQSPFAPRPTAAALLGPATVSDAPGTAERHPSSAPVDVKVTVPLEADRLRGPDTPAIQADLVHLTGHPAHVQVGGDELTFVLSTHLDDVLTAYQGREQVARSQLTTVLVGLVAGSGLVLVLAASLLVSRRRLVLALERARGASVTGVVVRALAESLAVAVLACALALLVAVGVGGGMPASADLLPAGAVLACVVAVPAVLAASVAWSSWAGSRVSTDRDDRRDEERERRSWAVALQAGVVVVAAGALAAARVRGFSVGGDLFASAAPVLVAGACCVGVVWLVPRVVHAVVRRRSRRWSAVPLVAATRGASTGGRLVALVTLAVVVTLAVFSGAQAATVDAAQRGDDDAAVGAVARVLHPGDGYAQWVARQVPDAHVEQASVVPGRAWGQGSGLTVTLLIVDAKAFPQFSALAEQPAPQVGGPVPALVDPSLVGPARAMKPSLSAFASPMTISVAGTTHGVPSLDSLDTTGDPVVVVDRDAMLRSTGINPALLHTDVVWLDGPGAARAATLAAGPVATVVTRAQATADLRADPLLGGMAALLRAASVALALLAGLSVALTVLAGGPERLRVLAVLRTLGVPRRAGRTLVMGELGPVLGAAVVSGALAGVLVAGLLTGVQGLGLLAHGAPIRLHVPWWPFVLVGAVTAAALLTGAWLEERGRRHARVGETLRTY